MRAPTAAARPREFVDVEHVGVVADGEEDTDSAEVQKWAGARERYTFQRRQLENQTLVEMKITEEDAGTFEDTWPRALEKLRALVEGEASAQE